jgi:uncharacterized protein YbaR (Trm112 family)
MPPTPARPTCPRCRGQLALTRDHHGRYLSCLICGYVHEIIDGAPLIDAKTPADTTQRPDAPHTAPE